MSRYAYDRLTVLDNSFLAFEGPNTPMHVATTMVYDVELSAAEMKKRLKAFKPKKPRYTTGALAKYARLVSTASMGAITDA